MFLETVRMRRGRNTLVIQGMQHVAPAGFYKTIQAEIWAAAARGQRVYFEGLRNNLSLDGLGDDERLIHGFFRDLFSTYDEIAEACGFVTQRNSLRYPPDAVNADMSVREVVASLARPGFRSRVILWLLRRFDTAELRREFQQHIKANPPRDMLLHGSPLQDVLRRLYLMPAWDVLIDFRNFLPVDAVERDLKTGIADGAYVCYGQAHVSGIVDFFKERGWEVIAVNKRSLASFLDGAAP